MLIGRQKLFSGPVTVFHDRRLPEAAIPVGYTALIDAYDLAVPAPFILSAIGPRHKIYEADGWRVYTPRYTRRDARRPSDLCVAL